MSRAVERHEDILRKLAIRDDAYVESVLASADESGEASGLDPKSRSLIGLAAMIAMDAAPPSYLAAVEAGLACGVTKDEMVGVLVAVTPTVGLARVVSAAPKLALALGYDLVLALEERTEGRSSLWEGVR